MSQSTNSQKNKNDVTAAIGDDATGKDKDDGDVNAKVKGNTKDEVKLNGDVTDDTTVNITLICSLVQINSRIFNGSHAFGLIFQLI